MLSQITLLDEVNDKTINFVKLHTNTIERLAFYPEVESTSIMNILLDIKNKFGISSNSDYVNLIHDARKSFNKLTMEDHINYAKERSLKEKTNNEENYNINSDSKECPKCAETIKAKAIICRFCMYNFQTKRFE